MGPSQTRALAGWWQARPVLVQDGLVALLYLALATTPGIAGLGVALGELPVRPFDGPAALLVVAQCVPLVIRRRWPLTSLTVIALAFAVHEVFGFPPTFAGTALIVSLYSVGAHCARGRLVVTGVATVAYIALAVVLTGRGSPERPFDFFTFYVLIAACAVAGARVRAWRQADDTLRELAAETARAHERTLIARELHDVVTHHVTAMVIQADATQFLLATPDRVAAGLTAVSETGRRALSDLRGLLDLLDTTGGGTAARTPAVGRLRDLVEHSRLAGQQVELTEAGQQRALSGRVDLAVYRVVQEALTNAAKHARGHPTSVRVRYAEREVEITVDTDGPPVADPVPGRGLTGLRERVGLLGGHVAATSRPGGGVTVAARIPYGDGS